MKPWVLNFLHAIGLTNLTDEQVEMYNRKIELKKHGIKKITPIKATTQDFRINF
jgi:hypothetical protein